MSGYLAFGAPDFGLLPERLTRTGLCDFEGVRVPERRIFIAGILGVRKPENYTNLNEKGSTKGWNFLYSYKSRRPSIDFNNVTSSAYSMSMPTGIP